MVNGGSYTALNDLKFVNCGTAGVFANDECLVFQNASNTSLTNLTLVTHNWISVYFVYTSAGSYSNITFTGNDVSGTSNAIWIASAHANTSVHTVNVSGNTFHDYHIDMVGGAHGNGLHYYAVPATDSTQYLDGMTFCNNRTYGDFTSNGVYTGANTGGGMTAFFFSENPLSGLVCNNDFSFSPVQAAMFNSLICIGKTSGNTHSMSLQIYGNSLVNAGTNAMSAGINISGLTAGDSTIVKNNIASGMQNCIYAQDSGSMAALTSDYNLWNCSSGLNRLVSTYYTYAQWQGLGYDTHGVLGRSPSWVSAPGNENLTVGSPAIHAGANLAGLGIAALDTDITGAARPASGLWDIGSFQFHSPLIPPSGLSVTVH
jgi:hypothetical protein